MLHEFAVDPDAVSDWQRLRFLVSHFGIPHGRLISRFPKDWRRLVYEAATPDSPINKQRFVECLNSTKSKMLHARRNYDPQLPWMTNAVTSHAEQPFQDIISTSERARSLSVSDIDQLSDSDPKWQVGTGRRITRSALELSNAAAVLLSGSREIVFVDQHYSCSAKHVRPLSHFIQFACATHLPNRFEYHLSAKGTAHWFSSELIRQIPQLSVPKGVKLIFVRWNMIPGGENLHPRYILTERGGLQYDYGLDEGSDGETTDVHLLSERLHLERWLQHLPTTHAFSLSDAWVMTTDTVRRAELRHGLFMVT